MHNHSKNTVELFATHPSFIRNPSPTILQLTYSLFATQFWSN